MKNDWVYNFTFLITWLSHALHCTKLVLVFTMMLITYNFCIKASSLAGYFPQVDCRTFDVLINGMRYLAPQKWRLI